MVHNIMFTVGIRDNLPAFMIRVCSYRARSRRTLLLDTLRHTSYIEGELKVDYLAGGL